MPANLAEGHSRTGRDRAHLWRIAYGSAKEVDSHLQLLAAAGAVNRDQAAGALQLFDRVRAMTSPASFMRILLRATMHRTQHRFLTSACSTYRRVRLRAPRVENTPVHGTSPPSRRNLMNDTGKRLLHPVG